MYRNIVNKPFPINTRQRYWLRGTGFGLFVFLFLFLFKPFRLDLYDTPQLLYTAAVYGCITGVVIFLGELVFIKAIAPHVNEDRWTLGKQVLWNMLLMVCIAWLNVYITQLMHNLVLPLWWHFNMLKWVIMLGVFPVVVAELLSYNHYLQQHVKSAARLSQLAQQPQHSLPLPATGNAGSASDKSFPVGTATGGMLRTAEEEWDLSTFMLTGENHGDKLELTEYSLLAVQALDNYVNVFWEEAGCLQTTMLRNTLTNIVEQLNAVSGIYRSHRGWLVNIRRVNQVEGNAQGLRLSVDLMQQQVPVSRGNIAGYRRLAETQSMMAVAAG